MLSAFWPVWLARAAWNSEGGKGDRGLVWNLPKVNSGCDPERGGQSSPAGRAHQFRVHLEQKVEEKQRLKGFPSLQTSAPAIRPSRHPEPEHGRLCQERSHECFLTGQGRDDCPNLQPVHPQGTWSCLIFEAKQGQPSENFSGRNDHSVPRRAIHIVKKGTRGRPTVGQPQYSKHQKRQPPHTALRPLTFEVAFLDWNDCSMSRGVSFPDKTGKRLSCPTHLSQNRHWAHLAFFYHRYRSQLAHT